MSIWLGAWCPVVRAICADMPFLGNIRLTLLDEVYRYPLKELSDFMQELPLGQERVLHTLSYFDTAYQATRWPSADSGLIGASRSCGKAGSGPPHL